MVSAAGMVDPAAPICMTYSVLYARVSILIKAYGCAALEEPPVQLKPVVVPVVPTVVLGLAIYV